jgi:hypothetical protein
MMRALLAWALSAACAAQAPVLVANYAGTSQRGWCYVGLPEPAPAAAGWLQDSQGELAPWTRQQGGIRVWVSLLPNEQRKLEWLAKDRKDEPFRWHPTIEANALRILPSWTLGDVPAPVPTIRFLRITDVSCVVHLRTVWPTQRVTLDCWLTATSGEPTIEWVQIATYGDTRNNGQAQSVLLPALRMRSAARIVHDEGSRHGVGMSSWADGIWTQVCTVEGARWHRASRFLSRGALLPASDPARLEGKPLVGLSLGWQGRWGPMGLVPQATADMVAAASRQRDAWQRKAWGTYMQPRPEAQPQNSGQTGEQPGFGWASHWAVSLQSPWQVLDGLWQVEGYAIRPTANREPDGSPMRAVAHPQAETLGQRPDLGFGANDRIGWPGVNQIGWMPSPNTVLWTTEDDQHRSSADLAAMVALTRCPALESIVEDQIELDGTDYYVKRRVTPSARAIGRLALARAHWVWLGYRSAELALRDALDAALAARASTWPSGAVRPIGPVEQAKYGWTANGQPVMGWQPWQQVIAAGGLRAAGCVLQEPRYLAAAVEISELCLDNAYLFEPNAVRHAYAIAYNGAQQWPLSAWPQLGAAREGSTDAIYVVPDCSTWTVGAAMLAPQHPSSAKVLAATPVRTLMDARWRALR